MKVTLHCTDVEVLFARNQKEAHEFREGIDGIEIDLAYMPDKGEEISLFTKRGWVEFKIGTRGISHCFPDAYVREECLGKTEYGLWAERLSIMELFPVSNQTKETL